MGSTSTGGVPAGTGTYPPIEIDPKRQIRVLTLLPRCQVSTAQISCELFILDLPTSRSQNAALDFDALSYAWGSKTGSSPVLLNGGIGNIKVTNSLRAALERLRSDECPRRLWVDQICIDQSNVRERNHQVLLMARLYRQAARVIVWLGQGRGGTGG